ncbi:hypothetical protein JOF56_007870 [Kibdelosporangium banguiense]|uniref:Uncharacterized protein n=1 Tax=Kibdelosporangium banguiense TaxID=1365924 RepID=A0ABS4TU45_9PSEU|nr:hypothetical protein [Kibdelosporangium banguiense]MBP2327485.1 hypothetical protein [Kibdelosporangium banguiense]
MTTTCPSCGWPTDDLPTSAHRTSEGIVDYRRCVCGTWLVQLNGSTVATR